MWVMQRNISAATLAGVTSFPKATRSQMPNPLVNTYRTQDNRFVALCMLQSQRYWADFCEVIDRRDLATDPRFATDADRAQNKQACVEILDEVFAARPLAEWRERLARQDGQWDVVQESGELKLDPQVIANGYMQSVDYGDGRALTMVSTPIQFDREVLQAGPAPDLGAHSDEILSSLGFDEDGIIDLKVAGIVL
jgi:crotonobetainyl-CoA:carnitine CoA-transferase CaiB-like acyl-CoA transferase